MATRALTGFWFIGIVAPVVRLYDDGGVAQVVEQAAHIRSVRGPSPFAAMVSVSPFHVLTDTGWEKCFFLSHGIKMWVIRKECPCQFITS